MNNALKVLALAVSCSVAGFASAAPQSAQAPAGNPSSDVYHIHFNKAAPGQAEALGARLKTPDPKAPMPDHLLVLRHQEGDDWDYCVIEHLGAKATVDSGGSPVPPAARDQSAWHTDTFAAGPSWAEFARAMGIGAAEADGSAIYVVSVQRALPGHRDQLEKLLRNPAPSKVPSGNVVLQHLEGGPWNFLTLTRYNSWADFAKEQATPAGTAGQWDDVRMHSASHHDTIADRVK